MTIIRKFLQTLYNFVTAFMILSAAIVSSYFFWSGKTPQRHIIIESRLEPNVIKSGMPLHTYVKTDRRVDPSCSLMLHRFITQWDTGIVIWSQISPGMANNNGVQEIRRVVSVIPPLPPGEYGYLFRAVNDCGNHVMAPVDSKIAKFTVTD